jgi:galactofuranose transport system permease protein
MPGDARLTAIAIILLVPVIGGALLLHLVRFGANVYALGGSLVALARRPATKGAGAAA